MQQHQLPRQQQHTATKVLPVQLTGSHPQPYKQQQGIYSKQQQVWLLGLSLLLLLLLLPLAMYLLARLCVQCMCRPCTATALDHLKTHSPRYGWQGLGGSHIAAAPALPGTPC